MNAGIKALKRAVRDHFGSQSAVARVVGVTPQAISDIIRKPRDIPAEWCVKIEAASDGKVKRSDLRPDLWPRTANAA